MLQDAMQMSYKAAKSFHQFGFHIIKKNGYQKQSWREKKKTAMKINSWENKRCIIKMLIISLLQSIIFYKIWEQ